MVNAEVEANTKKVHVYDIDLVTLRGAVSCHIHDALSSMFKERKSQFDQADVIVLERQPPMSAGAPLEFMFRERYRSKCVFVCPQTLHKHFELSGYEYEARKEKSVNIASQFLQYSSVIHKFSALARKHDVSDAVLLLMYYSERVSQSAITNVPFSEFVESCRSSCPVRWVPKMSD